MNLSERLRPDVECAPWVIEEVKKLEYELKRAYQEMNKQRPSLTAVFDSGVWVKVEAARKSGWLFE